MRIILFNLFLFGCVFYAFVRGGAPERVVAAAFIAAATATYIAWPSESGNALRYGSIEFTVLLIDTLLLAILVTVALWANRFWPIWIAALQLFALLVHVAKAYQRDILPWIYYVITSFASYPMLLMLVFGALFHVRRVQRHGSDPDWSFRLG